MSGVCKLVSTVRPRPNYYEILGIAPTAASDEIAKAFARATSVFRPHPFGAITEACLAFETLRNPIKRRAYDLSIGLISGPAPRVAPTVTREAPSSARPASPYPVERTNVGTAPSPAPQVKPTSQPEPAAKPSASVLPPQPVGPNAVGVSPAPAPIPDPQYRGQIDDKPRIAPQIGGDVSRHLSLEEQFALEASPIDWKRMGKVAGAVTVAACSLGLLAGWWSAGDIGEPQQPQEAASLPPPQSDQVAPSEAPPPVPAQSVREERPNRPKRVAVSAARVDRAPTFPQLGPQEEQPPTSQPGDAQLQESQPEPSQLELGASEQDAPTESVAPTVTSSMPLPNKVIARTIERIGYSCGAVTSSSPVEGEAPGVYKITCASGQSYQARPVNGRYRFRRWGRQ